MNVLRWSAAALVAAAVLAGCRCGRGGDAVDAGARESAADAGGVTAEAEPVPEPVALLREAASALQAGDHDLAIQKAEQVIALQPTNAVAYNVIGQAASARFAASGEQRDAAKAREAFTKATQASPTFWPAMENLADLEEKAGRKAEAAALYGRILELEPTHPRREQFEAAIAAAKAKAK